MLTYGALCRNHIDTCVFASIAIISDRKLLELNLKNSLSNLYHRIVLLDQLTTVAMSSRRTYKHLSTGNVALYGCAD